MLDSPSPVSFEAVASLLDELREADFLIGLHQYLAVYSLLSHLAGNGEDLSAHQLRGKLGPILCKSPEQQTAFGPIFDAWSGGHTPAARDDPSTVRVAQADASGRIAHRPLGSSLARIRTVAFWLALISILVGAVALWAFLAKAPSPSAPKQGVAPRSGVAEAPGGAVRPLLPPASTFEDKPEWPPPGSPMPPPVASTRLLGIHPLLAALILGATGGLWLALIAARAAYLRRITSRAGLREQDLFARAVGRTFKHGTRQIRLAARELRRAERGSRLDLDVERTMESTLRQAGLFTAVFRPGSTTPEHLAFVERISADDQQARFYHELIDELEREGVVVERYDFDRDPRVLHRHQEGSLSSSLTVASRTTPADLSSRHHAQRLLIFGDGLGLFDSNSARMAKWVEHFAHWPQRTILTPRPPESWARAEGVLSDAGWLILPARSGALPALAEWIQSARAVLQIDDTWPTGYPEMLRSEPMRWLSRAAPDAAVQASLIHALKSYLRGEQFTWLCACAVYPALSYGLTRYLVLHLSKDPRLVEPGVASLASLPWFRYGAMPQWLRRCLIVQLTRFDDHRLRELLYSLLETAGGVRRGVSGMTLAPIASDPDERVGMWTRARRWFIARGRARALGEIARRESPDSPLRDTTYLTYMWPGLANRLALRVPERIRRLVYRGGLPLLGLRALAWIPLALAYVGLLAISVVGPTWWPSRTQQLKQEIMVAAGLVDAPLPMISPYLESAAAGKAITSVSFGRASDRFATAQGAVAIWDAATLELPPSLPDDGSLKVVLHSEENRVAAIDALGDVHIWNARASREERKLQTELGPVRDFSVSLDGNVLATLSGEHDVHLWVPRDGTLLGELGQQATSSRVTVIAISPDGRMLATGSADGTIALWDVPTRSPLPYAPEKHGASVTTMTFGPDSRTLASAGEDGNVVVWSIDKRLPLTRVGAKDVIIGLSLDRAGETLAALERRGRVTLWDLTVGKPKATLGPASHPTLSIAFSPDGWRIATGDADGKIHLYGRPLPLRSPPSDSTTAAIRGDESDVGPTGIEVIDVTGQPIEVATARLRRTGLKVAEKPSTALRCERTVLAQDPRAGSQVERGNTVKLSVANVSENRTPLICRGGSLEVERGGLARIIRFKKATQSAVLGLASGECSWQDRGMAESDPSLLRYEGSLDSVALKRLGDERRYWKFNVMTRPDSNGLVAGCISEVRLDASKATTTDASRSDRSDQGLPTDPALAGGARQVEPSIGTAVARLLRIPNFLGVFHDTCPDKSGWEFVESFEFNRKDQKTARLAICQRPDSRSDSPPANARGLLLIFREACASGWIEWDRLVFARGLELAICERDPKVVEENLKLPTDILSADIKKLTPFFRDTCPTDWSELETLNVDSPAGLKRFAVCQTSAESRSAAIKPTRSKPTLTDGPTVSNPGAAMTESVSKEPAVQGSTVRNGSIGNLGSLLTGVVKVVSTNGGGKADTADWRIVGAGFVVSVRQSGDVSILTAAHVVGDNKECTVQFSQSSPLRAQVISIDHGRDIALLSVRSAVNSGRMQPLRLDSGTRLVSGQELTIGWLTAGSATGGDAGIRLDSTSLTFVGEAGSSLILQGRGIGEGNSGSPVLHKGAVVGMVTEYDGKATRAASAALLEDFLAGSSGSSTTSSRRSKADADKPGSAPFSATELEYQIRSNGNARYFEGVKAKPVSGFDIELISARVDADVGASDSGAGRFFVRFFLRQPSPVYIVVRELDYSAYYWLDRVRPDVPWKDGSDNVFHWSTADVVEPLGLRITDLAVVARLDRDIPSAFEKVIPIAFYQNEKLAPERVTGYRFDFRLREDAKLRVNIYSPLGGKPIMSQDPGLVSGNRSFSVRWKFTSPVPEGVYRLVVNGYLLSTNDPITQFVEFYHRPSTNEPAK